MSLINCIVLLIGVVLGIYLYKWWLILLDINYVDLKIKKPLMELKKRGLEIYTFVYRQGSIVVLQFDEKKSVYLNLTKKTVSIYEDNNFLFGTDDRLQFEFDLFYNNLIGYFYDEIYNDVVLLDNVIYSKNIFSSDTLSYLNTLSEEEKILNARKYQDMSVDNILDKIHTTGMNSLSEEERQFLKKHSEKND